MPLKIGDRYLCVQEFSSKPSFIPEQIGMPNVGEVFTLCGFIKCAGIVGLRFKEFGPPPYISWNYSHFKRLTEGEVFDMNLNCLLKKLNIKARL